MKTQDQHTTALEHAAAIEARTDRKRVRFTIEQAEAAQVKAEKSRRRKLKGKHRPGLKSNGLSWLTTFQRAVYLALTNVKQHGLARTWFSRRIKLPRETI